MGVWGGSFQDSYIFITKTVETSRVHLFDIITQYKAVFSHPIDRDRDQNSSEGLLAGWILQRVTEFLQDLGDHLPRLVDRFNTVLGQCMVSPPNCPPPPLSLPAPPCPPPHTALRYLRTVVTLSGGGLLGAPQPVPP